MAVGADCRRYKPRRRKGLRRREMKGRGETGKEEVLENERKRGWGKENKDEADADYL